MSILVDDRVGSRHLQPLIPHSELTRLEYGDAAFSTVDGRLVGIEVKRVSDAVNCLYTGRLADHQIPGLRQCYDIVYLVIEGVYRPEPGTGVLQLWREFDSSKEVKCGRWQDVTSGRKRLMYSSFVAWMTSLQVLGGISALSTDSAPTTAALLVSLYNWWQRESHDSLKTLHYPEGDGASLSRPTMLRRMLALLPHVAWDRSAILLPRVGGIQFLRRNGKPMRPEDWYIERQIADKSIGDIVRACDGED